MRRWLATSRPMPQPHVRTLLLVDDDSATRQVPSDDVRSVRVDDLAEVLEHRIVRVMGSTSHVLRFVGDGELRYVYDARGQVIDLSAVGLRAAISPQRAVSFADISPGSSGWR
jgi:hypothetical protein